MPAAPPTEPEPRRRCESDLVDVAILPNGDSRYRPDFAALGGIHTRANQRLRRRLPPVGCLGGGDEPEEADQNACQDRRHADDPSLLQRSRMHT